MRSWSTSEVFVLLRKRQDAAPGVVLAKGVSAGDHDCQFMVSGTRKRRSCVDIGEVIIDLVGAYKRVPMRRRSGGKRSYMPGAQGAGSSQGRGSQSQDPCCEG
eukprot:scaffold14905_cov113-Isochrysis_galbana.AAC.1